MGPGKKPLKDVTAAELGKLINHNSQVETIYIKDFTEIVNYLNKILQPKDLVLTMGAGDVYQIGEKLLKKFISGGSW